MKRITFRFNEGVQPFNQLNFTTMKEMEIKNVTLFDRNYVVDLNFEVVGLKALLSENPIHEGMSAGICIKKNTRGLYLHSDMTAIFVNPLMDTVCGEVWVDCILETIVHELAHVKANYHGESHNSEMRKIRSSLIRNGILLEIDGKLRRIYNDHAAELEVLEDEFNKSNAVQTALD